MPSIRKRIGYLPTINSQEIITSIAQKEKLSQSKVVGILVEEALKARGLFEHQNTNILLKERSHSKKNNINNFHLKYDDLDELISDKGITYNSKKYKPNSGNSSSKQKETYNGDLFELFKQFMMFKKMLEEN
tara:strand:+ start:305 stop:700 length:396 start_codon:yes stop_codon:yes gene_type:complete